MTLHRFAGLRRRAAVLGFAALLTAGAGVAVVATTSTSAPPDHTAGTRLSDVRVLAHFDRAAGQAAESITLEPDGGAVIGLIPARQVVRVTPDGDMQVLVTLPPLDGGGTTPLVGSPVVTGVARSEDGALYFLYAAGQGGMTGIWRVHPSGEPQLVVSLPADTLQVKG
ncbi:hypothetical protein [Nocardia asteroides]|uniref:hypothetical protein n=1 Tax=Nocardia asteroides TaxID=1824 RepID=UPI00341299A6